MTEMGCHMHLIGFKGNKILSVFLKKREVIYIFFMLQQHYM